MAKRKSGNELFDVLKAPRHAFDSEGIVKLFSSVSADRVGVISAGLAEYIGKNLPAAFEKRDRLSDYPASRSRYHAPTSSAGSTAASSTATWPRSTACIWPPAPMCVRRLRSH